MPDNFDQAPFGATGFDTEYYAQSVLADDARWASLAFGITDLEGGRFDLIVTEGRSPAIPLPGSGLAPDATAVLSQQMLDHLGGGLQIFYVDLNLPVISGTTYFFTLAAFGQTLTNATVRATEFNGRPDKYAPGEFIFSNDNAGFSNDLAWVSRFSNREDLAFRATFDSVSAVPVPPALPLFGAALGMLVLFGVWRRRKLAP
ncbi:MAG: hypothetical protein OER92_09035 [Alphaproteobacteria bacterium]|nr:hypothetical protein [Alphaproteobacteria bacterium]